MIHVTWCNICYCIAGMFGRERLGNLAKHQHFAKLKSSKLVTINNLLVNLFVHQTFHQNLYPSAFAKQFEFLMLFSFYISAMYLVFLCVFLCIIILSYVLVDIITWIISYICTVGKIPWELKVAVAGIMLQCVALLYQGGIAVLYVH